MKGRHDGCGLFVGVACEASVFDEREGVAAQARELGALDGAASEALDVSLVGERGDLFEVWSDVAVARLEPRLAGRPLEAVPGADVLADVAAVAPALQVFGDPARQLRRAQLNRRVGDASRRNDYVR